MILEHTHRTHQMRTGLRAALHLMLVFHGPWNMDIKNVDDFEQRWRGTEEYEKTVRRLAAWLESFSPGFEAKTHECRGQLCG